MKINVCWSLLKKIAAKLAQLIYKLVLLSSLFLAYFISGCAVSEVTADESVVTTLVYVNSGAIQCEFQGYSPDETAKRLTDKGIAVVKSQCGIITGQAYAAMCGGGTTKMNLHEISTKDSAKAKALGFNSVAHLQQGADLGYEITDCPE